MESLAFCHRQDESHWTAARVIVQQDIDGFVAHAGASLSEKRDALKALMAGFADLFPDEDADPVLIRSYMRRQLRKIEYDLKREKEPAAGDSPATATSNVAPDASHVADEQLAEEPGSESAPDLQTPADKP